MGQFDRTVQNLLRIVLLFFSLVLICSGLWVVIPSNNLLVHFLTFDTLIDQCNIPGTLSTIRLYRRDISAFDAYTYVAMYQESFLVTEREIVVSQGYPEITQVVCNAKEVGVGGIVIPVSQLKKYVENPIVYVKGRPAQAISFGFAPQLICTLCGVWLMGLGFLLAMLLLITNRKSIRNKALKWTEHAAKLVGS